MVTDKNTNSFHRVVEADNQIVTEYKNEIYDLINTDNLTVQNDPKIKLKNSDKNIIIKQLISDLVMTNNKLNLVMMLIDQFCYEGLISNEILNALEQVLNTEDRRNSKQK